MRGWNKATLSGNQKIICLSMNKFQRLQCIISSSMTMFCYKPKEVMGYKRLLEYHGKMMTFDIVVKSRMARAKERLFALLKGGEQHG